ncbi:MAG: hypothetical protein ACYCS9_05860 [Candidatus Dormibacteria bacterium]
MTGQRKRAGGRRPPLLEPDSLAQVVATYRATRLRQGADPGQVDGEVRRRFGPDLAAAGADEVGTGPLFGTPPEGQK